MKKSQSELAVSKSKKTVFTVITGTYCSYADNMLRALVCFHLSSLCRCGSAPSVD